MINWWFRNPNSQHVGPPKTFWVWHIWKKKSDKSYCLCATHCQWLFGSCTTNFLSKWRFWTVKWPNIPLKPTWHLLNINLTKSIKAKKWFACGRWTFKFLNIQNISNIFLGKLLIISVKNYFFKNAYHRHLRDNWRYSNVISNSNLNTEAFKQHFKIF